MDDIDYEIIIENLNSNRCFYLLIFIFNIFMIVLGFFKYQNSKILKICLELLYLLVLPIRKKQSFGVGFGHNFGSNLIQCVSPSRSLCLHMMDGHVPYKSKVHAFR